MVEAVSTPAPFVQDARETRARYEAQNRATDRVERQEWQRAESARAATPEPEPLPRPPAPEPPVPLPPQPAAPLRADDLGTNIDLIA